MSDLQIFNNPEFGEVRWIELDGKPYAVGNDIAGALEYARPYEAVTAHCHGAVTYRVTDSLGREQDTKVIPEGDIYRLIVKAADQSKNPEIKAKAERFESWIFDEVIPTIRKTGTYTAPCTPTEALLQTVQALVNQERQIKELQAGRLEHQQKLETLGHRVDNMDAVNTIGDMKQRLNNMIRKYARQRGILYSVAWSEFKQAYNTAYHTNIELLILNYKKDRGLKKVTIPQYLLAKDKLEDGIRVADKMLNQCIATGTE